MPYQSSVQQDNPIDLGIPTLTPCVDPNGNPTNWMPLLLQFRNYLFYFIAYQRYKMKLMIGVCVYVAIKLGLYGGTRYPGSQFEAPIVDFGRQV